MGLPESWGRVREAGGVGKEGRSVATASRLDEWWR